MPTTRASRTAVLVCQGRAVADGRLAVGRFSDPVAVRLLHGDELLAVERARAGHAGSHWRERYRVEFLRVLAEVMVPRTVAIDDAVRRAGHRQVVLLGAGLDGRPWRLDALAGAVVFAVDRPASLADTRARSAGLTPVADRLVPVAVDLGADDLGDALTGAGHDPSVPTTWVWEGVVPYLTRDAVAATVHEVARLSAAGSVLAVAYQSSSFAADLGVRLFTAAVRIARRDHPLVTEPWRSLWSPADLRSLLSRNGFTVETDEDLVRIAERLGSPRRRRRSLGNGRVAVARALSLPGPPASPGPP